MRGCLFRRGNAILMDTRFIFDFVSGAANLSARRKRDLSPQIIFSCAANPIFIFIFVFARHKILAYEGCGAALLPLIAPSSHPPKKPTCRSRLFPRDEKKSKSGSQVKIFHLCRSFSVLCSLSRFIWEIMSKNMRDLAPYFIWWNAKYKELWQSLKRRLM